MKGRAEDYIKKYIEILGSVGGTGQSVEEGGDNEGTEQWGENNLPGDEKLPLLLGNGTSTL